MEILRKNELNYMKKLVRSNPHGKYLITGAAGSGKSFFINVLAKDLLDSGMKVAPFTGGKLHKHIKEQLPFSIEEIDTVYLCDGLDEFYQPRRVYEAIKNSHNGFICTARQKIFDIEFDYELNLQPLKAEQMVSLLYKDASSEFIKDTQFWNNLIQMHYKLYNQYSDNEVTPLLMNLYISYFAEKDKNEQLREFLSNYWQVYMYGEKVSLQAPEIIVPEKKIIRVPAELKNDINVINNSLLESVSRTPSLLDELTPRQFEELVCELFQKKGYNVRLTKQTRDGGKDIIVLNNNFLGDFIIYAECKKFARSHPVGVALVRQLYGTVEADKATAGIMVTTSSFSREAKKFRETVRGRMSLVDYTELIQEIIKFK